MRTIAGAFANDRKFEHKQYLVYYADRTVTVLMPNRDAYAELMHRVETREAGARAEAPLYAIAVIEL